MNHIYFFIYSDDAAAQQLFLSHLRRSPDHAVVSLSEERFYTKHWEGMETFLHQLGPLALVPEEEWQADLHAKRLVFFWKHALAQGARDVFAILPEEMAPYLQRTRLERVLHWISSIEIKPGASFWFDYTQTIPQQQPLCPLKQRTLRQLLRKNAVA